MRDLAIRLENRPGALAEMGEAFGSAGVSVEGGGAFVFDGKGIAHFLFEDTVAARKALEEKGIAVLEDREVLVQRLNQNQPGQLGKISRMMAEAGVNILVKVWFWSTKHRSSTFMLRKNSTRNINVALQFYP